MSNVERDLRLLFVVMRGLVWREAGVSTLQEPIHPFPKINQRDEAALGAIVKMQDSVYEAIRVS